MEFLNKHKFLILSFVIGFVIGLILMFFIAPNRTIKFKNGSEVIIEYNKSKVSIDELYDYYQSKSGITPILYLIDKGILKEKYASLNKEASKIAKNQAEYYYTSYETMYNKSKEDFLIDNGYTEESFLEYLETNYYSEIYYIDYLKQFISENDIKKEYNNVFGDKYVYTFSSQDSTKDLENIRNDLKKGLNVEDITKKYKNVIFNDIGTIGYESSDTFSSQIIKEIRNLKANSYSGVIKDDSFGYVVIYISEAVEKPSFDDAKDSIIKLLAERKAKEDDSLYYKAFIELRKEANLKIKDKNLSKMYDEYVKSILK